MSLSGRLRHSIPLCSLGYPSPLWEHTLGSALVSSGREPASERQQHSQLFSGVSVLPLMLNKARLGTNLQPRQSCGLAVPRYSSLLSL